MKTPPTPHARSQCATVLLILLAGAHALAAGQSPPPLWTLQGAAHGDSVGIAQARIGDVNNDSIDDLLVGVSGFNGNQGAALIFLGAPGGPATTPFWTVVGEGTGAFGSSVTLAGNVNGDAFPDVLIAAPALEAGGTRRGRVYLFPGTASGPSPIATWMFTGTFDFATMGRSISTAGDVNGDGFDDVLVSSTSPGDSDGGQVFLFYGSSNGLSLVPDWTMESDRSSSRFGWAMAALGDIDLDGYDDVAISSTWYESSTHGRVFVFRGSATGLPTELSSALGISEPPGFSGPEFGASLAGAGDVNGDGFHDLVVGAPYHSVNHAEEGLVFLYFGSQAGLPVLPSWYASSGNDLARLGYSVGGVGDFNGDGFDDIIAGAYLFVSGGNRTGAAAVFLGRSTVPSPHVAVWLLGERTDSYFGFAVAGAGDLNEDGLADALIGAPHFAMGGSIVGKVYAYAGDPLVTFADGFEDGSTDAWSATVP